MFTAWNDSAQTWTLNPLVPGDGNFDADNDAMTDAQEFSLLTTNPDNGENHPLDAPVMHIDGDLNDPTQKAQRVYTIILDKGQRGKRHLEQFQEWQSTGIANTFISTLMSITDPTISDTDDDGISNCEDKDDDKKEETESDSKEEKKDDEVTKAAKEATYTKEA